MPTDWRCLHAKLKRALVDYLRLRIVSITLTSRVLDVLDVLDVAAGVGVGAALPSVGISPAKIEVDSAHTSTTAVANRFMVLSSFGMFKKMRRFSHKKEQNRTMQHFLLR